MQFIKYADPFMVQANASLGSALEKISSNTKGFVIVIEKDGKLSGTLTDGDVRRFLVSSNSVNLSLPISVVTNTDCHFATSETAQELLESIVEKFGFCPLVDADSRISGVYLKGKLGLEIGEFHLSEEDPCFIIAEIGNNHNGSVELARDLVDLAVDAGADCVKFQMRNMEKLYKLRNDAEEDLGAQYTFDLLDRFQLSNDELFEVFDYCKEQGTLPLCTPWDEDSLAVLESYGMPAYKVASADMTNHYLLSKLIETGKPLILSTGMSTEQEVVETISVLQEKNASFVLLHCNSTYPAPFNEINLNYMSRLKQLSQGLVGYSGHERGIGVSIASVALGAKVVERHFTIDKSMEGNDHKVSLLPAEFRAMVQGIRQVEAALGNEESRSLSQGELMNREILGKSLYFLSSVAAGETFRRDHFGVTSPGKGLSPIKLKSVIGKTAKKDFATGDFIYDDDVSDEDVVRRDWKFPLKHGIPVRYYDYEDLYENSSFDIVEFHLSYQDLELDISKYLNGTYAIDFLVHCPELYKGDHLLNLVSDDPEYLALSRKNLDQTIEETLKLQPYFPSTQKPLLITNVGGFSENEFQPVSWRKEKYAQLADILNEYSDCGVEIIPQTMPPFPWHFGGQRYHNLFVDINEIVTFCETHGTRICFDISHSKLAASYGKLSFSDAIDKLAPHTAHLHIVDAKGETGEGLQIGEGEIPFRSIWPKIERNFGHASFVPEVWQGHKNGGSGFWKAFNKLESFQ